MTSHGGEISVTEAKPKIAEFVINHEIWEHWLLDHKLELAKINLKPSKYSENSNCVKKTVSGNDNFFRIKIAEQDLTG